MAKVLEVIDEEDKDGKKKKVNVRLYSLDELNAERAKITSAKDNVDLLRAWLVAAKVDLNNRKLDRELGPDAGRGN